MGRSRAWHRLRRQVLESADGARCPWCSHPIDTTTTTGPLAPVVDYQVPTLPGQIIPFDMGQLVVAHKRCHEIAGGHE